MTGGGVRVSVFGKTDLGLTRDHNEDTFLVADLSTGNASRQPAVREHEVGERGSLFCNYFEYRLFPQDRFKDFKPPPHTIPPSPGMQAEWINACLANNGAGDPTAVTCPFDYGGTVSEMPLLGTLALKVGKPIEWDGPNLKVANAPEAEKFLNTEYRPGWVL